MLLVARGQNEEGSFVCIQRVVRKWDNMRGKKLELQGQRFGRLTVLEENGRSKRRVLWKCQCDCGHTTTVLGASLVGGATQSCGCYHLEKIREVRVPDAAFNNLYTKYQYRAKKTGRIFELSREAFKELTVDSCFYCGARPEQVFRMTSGAEYTYNGVDRIDNNLGYVLGNVVPCCGVCNKMKAVLSQGSFLYQIRRVANHLKEFET